MGETVVRIKISPLAGGPAAEMEALVDTGATLTSIPRPELEKLGIQADQEMEVELADGRLVTRGMAQAWIELMGLRCANPILVAEGDACVVGLVTLESLGLGVDPVQRVVFKLPAFHFYSRRSNPRSPALSSS